MSRVLLLATTTGYQTRSFGEAAERVGIKLVFATDRCHVLDDPWQDQAIPIHFHDELAGLISGTIARWDGAETSDRLELLLGRDLQFIRINGTVVGGLAGLVIHGVAQLLG